MMDIQSFLCLLAMVIELLSIAVSERNKDASKALDLVSWTIIAAGIIVAVLL